MAKDSDIKYFTVTVEDPESGLCDVFVQAYVTATNESWSNVITQSTGDPVGDALQNMASELGHDFGL
jgi:hypothetical protein